MCTREHLQYITSVELASPPASKDDSPPPVLCLAHPSTSKLVVVQGKKLGARGTIGGSVMLKTILQTAASKPSDEVCIEVPVAQVRNPCCSSTSQYYTQQPVCTLVVWRLLGVTCWVSNGSSSCSLDPRFFWPLAWELDLESRLVQLPIITC